ncbi:MAG: response regulator transcription factor [Sulfurimicrobium sp.]|nr:response regulator transcription factor [Sulfurimicrobium sp.]MDP1705191.1 response regulator transcription factor [Sulfurimicrobium sp.]MDP1898544.1 response regulator transcription factor [Sulfurimicrobium sp.]MDP2197796.1 response regulator transcription factor [Sulfurimicrobium sp.]MDP2962432.1 response regulator transcription factor [Sulfurimicrobium sp.]
MKLALVLEDMPESQIMLSEVAQAAFPGINVHCVADIASALKILKQFQFDLALIDLSLPDGNGTTVVEAMATRFPASVIVVATIFDDDDHLFPALRAGAQGYLLKDQAPEQLVKQLYGISEGHPPLSPSVARRLLEHFRMAQENVTVGSVAGGAALTPREREVLVQLARGISIAEIGTVMGISRHTAGDHVKNIYSKLNISSRAEAALQAKSLGLI